MYTSINIYDCIESSKLSFFDAVYGSLGAYKKTLLKCYMSNILSITNTQLLKIGLSITDS